MQTVVDYENANGTLRLVRTHRSDQGMWRNNYQVFGINFRDRPVATAPEHANICGKDAWDGSERCYALLGNGGVRDFGVRRGNGRILHFGNSTDYSPPQDVNDRAVAVLDSSGATIAWRVTNSANDSTELFDTTGHLQNVTSRNGQVTTYTYSDLTTPKEIAPKAGYLIRVEDQFGHALQLTYFASGNMATMIDPAGQITAYEYDSANNLTKVTYPDGKSKTYIYDELDKTSNVAQGHLLTGIIDENGKRFATFTYYNYRKPKSTEHAGGAEKYSITYPYDYQPNVTDPLNSAYIYQHTNVLGVYRKWIEYRPAASGSGTVSSNTQYDANANISRYTDFDGTITTFSYDMARNLETKRVEGYNSPLARTISTEWHNAFRVPTRIAEPKRITSYTYDDHGNSLTRTVQATTDATGASGFSATPTGTPQVWTYTYDAYGHVLTAKGPRTDVNATASFTYDTEGNLATQTNAAGHVTAYSNYDPNGRVGRITDPNGLVTEMSYKPRGWLSSMSVGGETTSYDYDNAGQMTQVTLPDGSALYYTYDDAHRLTRIADNLGNSINYTLDNMGNRTNEQTKDVNGALTRQVTRVMNALNRVQQITGALQ
jgi:YD repeat-containing protein